MLSKADEIIHLTDFAFAQLCHKEYGLNRGIYNTIDSWFYNQGIENILERRRNILFFLEFLDEKVETKNLRPKFGSGGLTNKLQDYYLHSM
ncbi:MAG TPA: hypothetical protein VEY70_20045 [Metabacillus sp.]|nr:hypothetical protein [Metabacillus sp.]